MSTVVALTKQGSLLVPVAHEHAAALVDGQDELPARLVVGGTSLVRKLELHYTVFNSALGRALVAAFVTHPGLRAAIDEAAATFDWRFRLQDRLVQLVEDVPGKPALATLVVMIDAPIGAFFRKTRELVGEAAADAPELSTLQGALHAHPPAHITLYTSDASGGQGIGLAHQGELDAAFALAATPAPAPGLRAFELHSDVLRGTTGA